VQLCRWSGSGGAILLALTSAFAFNGEALVKRVFNTGMGVLAPRSGARRTALSRRADSITTASRG